MNVHTQRPIGNDLYTGLVDYVDLLENMFYFKNKTMIEIGSYQGESTEKFANLFGKVYAIDPWENGYDPSDISSYITDMKLVESAFDERIKKYPNIIKIKSKSEDVLPTFPEKVDFVYIDGIHKYDYILQDLHNASKISKYIGGHDWGWPGLLDAIKNFLKVDTLDNQPICVCKDSSWIINKQFI